MTTENNTGPTASELPTTTQAEVADPAMVTEPTPPEAPQIDEARAAIYAKHDAKRRAESGGGEPDPAPPDPEADEEITVKVNGRERQVPKSKVDAAGGIDAYQKNAAASELLNQASAERRRVQEEADRLAARERDLVAREQRMQEGQANQPDRNAGLPEKSGDKKALARQYHDAMLDGDIDKADELLLQLNATPQATAINPEEVADRAVQRARAEIENDQRQKRIADLEADRLKAVSEYDTKHKDLTAPEARTMVDDMTLTVMRDHPDWTPTQIIDEAAGRVRKAIQAVAGTGRDPRIEAKRRATLTRGGSARSTVPPAPRPQTKSEYVQDLRKSRGLA